jgi:hypothetical protein
MTANDKKSRNIRWSIQEIKKMAVLLTISTKILRPFTGAPGVQL